MIKLLMKSGEETRELEFNGGPISIGRSEDNSLKLPDKKASRKHAQIEKIGEEYLLTDLESGNGTKVNGQDVAGTRVLVKGDEIKIGFSSLYVLNLDTPAPAAALPAALPVATVVSPPPPPAPAPEAPAAEKKTPHTRRSHYHRTSSSGGRFVAVAAVLIIGGAIGFVGWKNWSKLPSNAPVASRPVAEKRVGPTLQEASNAYTAFQARAATAEVSEALVAEANALFQQYGEVYPDFERLVTDLSQKRLASQVSTMSFEQVNGLVQAKMAEKKFGDAIDALKVLKGSKDAAQAGTVLEKILGEVRAEFKSVDDFGKKLAEQKQYSAAAEHYRKEASRFRGTEHYRFLANKPENLQMLADMELAAARAREVKPAPVEIAKTEPAPEPPKPKPEPMKPPAMEPPKPKPEPMKPPAMEPPKPKPEPPKPPPPPPPPPTPKPEPAKPAADAPKEDGPKAAVKKPAVLCEVKRTGKGNYCVKCDRTLGPDDLRKNVCKRCEEKPKKIDLCVKRYFQAECHPEKVDDKPVFC